MVRKKNDSTAMDPRIEVLERRLQELEVRNQRRFEEAITRMEEMFIAAWQQRQTKSLSQAKGKPVVLTDDSNGIPKLENFIDTKQTPDQPSLVEERIEETVLEREESSSQNFKKQCATTSSTGSKKSDVETEYCKVQIWSKQNVSLALKMRGITVRWRRSRATQDSRIVSKKTSHRKGVQNCNDEMAEPSPPKHLGALPVVRESVRTTSRTKQREESQKVGNEPPPPPEPPDPNAQGGNTASSLFLVRVSSLWVQLLKRITLFLPSASPLMLIMGWLLMKPPWVSLVDMCKKGSLTKQRIERLFNKVGVMLEGCLSSIMKFQVYFDVHRLVMLSIKGITEVYDKWLGITYMAAIEDLTNEFLSWDPSVNILKGHHGNSTFQHQQVMFTTWAEINVLELTQRKRIKEVQGLFVVMTRYLHQQLILSYKHGWRSGVWWAHHATCQQ